MANMRHKSVTERSHRRRRYINVVDLFRKKYRCTAAEVFPIAQGIEIKNTQLNGQIVEMGKEIDKLNERIKTQEERILELEVKHVGIG